MRTGSEMDVGAIEPDQFGGPQARLDGDAEERCVAPPGPGRPVRRGQQGVDLRLGQVCDQSPFEAFWRDGQHPLDGGGMFGMAQGGIAEQGPDRGQPGVAGAYAVLSFVLQMVEEGADQRRIEIVDVELSRRLTVSFRREDQKQPQRVAIGLNRVRADLALADEAVGEECLQGRGEPTHASPARWRSSLAPARPRSSGAADRYQ
jgi:hypothetical protein